MCHFNDHFQNKSKSYTLHIVYYVYGQTHTHVQETKYLGRIIQETKYTECICKRYSISMCPL